MIYKKDGIQPQDDLHALALQGTNAMGLDFRLDSDQLVKMISSRAGIIPDYSRERLATAQDKATKPVERLLRVGIFADEMPQSIVTRVFNFDLDVVELRGEELPTMIENFRRTVVPDIQPNVKIWKTITVSSVDDLSRAKPYYNIADAIVFRFETDGETVCSLLQTTMAEVLTCSVPFLIDAPLSAEQQTAIAKHANDNLIGFSQNILS